MNLVLQALFFFVTSIEIHDDRNHEGLLVPHSRLDGLLRYLHNFLKSWAVHDIVSFYAPVIQAVTNAKIEHEMNQGVQKFFGIDPLSNHFIVDPTHHVLHNFGFQDKYKKPRRV